MGYTHYWYVTKVVEQASWAQICASARDVFERCGVPLADGSGDLGSSPEISDVEIVFNGVGEDSHETCALPRRSNQAGYLPPESRGFGFCKTARKPYDAAVCAVLALAEHFSKGAIKVSSDGNASEWAKGMALARSVCDQCPLPETLRAERTEEDAP